jgi:hypothetical protein
MIHPKVQTIFLNQFKKGEITVFDDFAVKFNSFDKYKSSISSVLILGFYTTNKSQISTPGKN